LGGISLWASKPTRRPGDVVSERPFHESYRGQIDPHRRGKTYLLHLEVESSAATGMAERLLHYNVNAVDYHKLPVWSLVLLLRPTSNPTDLQLQNGLYERSVLSEVSTTFKFTTIRVWNLDFETLLRSGGGMLALAMLTNHSMTSHLSPSSSSATVARRIRIA
jgi:hypothetical protein